MEFINIAIPFLNEIELHNNIAIDSERNIINCPFEVSHV